MTRNYQEKLSQEASILCRGKCGNYRDTGVFKNINDASTPQNNVWFTKKMLF